VAVDKEFHPSAKEGFGRSSELYDRARSEYSDASVQRLLKHLNIKPGARVLELGAGTGKFTGKLVGAGLNVTAIEPSAEMRGILKRNWADVHVVDAVAEELPFPTQYFDAVFAATSYHWFLPDKVYAEVARVLKPEGGLGLLWTSWAGDTPDWYQAIRKLMLPFEAGTPRYKHMKWREPFDHEIDFKMLQFERHDMPRLAPWTSQEIVERMLSTSYIAALPELVRLALRHEMDSVLKSYVLRGQVFKMPEELHMYWTHKED
jgi:ubiquinone/menaquinone biosynthesis C-methylase UbiE